MQRTIECIFFRANEWKMHLRYGNLRKKENNNQLLHRLVLNYYLNAGFDCIDRSNKRNVARLEIEYTGFTDSIDTDI